ncbi:MAG: copper chaperone PCu(A)C [bacterium]|jgi:copper(I)-binding protein
MKTLFLLLAFAASPALAQVSVDQPWMRATAPGARVAGGFMTIENQGAAPDRLVAAASPVAERVELHVHVHEGGVMKMQQMQNFEVPAKGQFVLKPGGAHLMFVNIKRQINQGEKIPVTLTFEKAGELNVDYAVGGLGAMGPGGAHGPGMKH